MKPETQSDKRPFRRISRCADQGFSIVSAVFLLVVLSGLSVAMIRFSTIHHTSAAMDEQGVHAYQAARAGIEWGLHAALIANSCLPNQSFTPPAPKLNQFRVTVNCVPVTSNPAVPITVRQITSFACNRPVGGACTKATAGGPDYVSRVLQVVF